MNRTGEDPLSAGAYNRRACYMYMPPFTFSTSPVM
jgi:hypothetical protein